MTNCSPGSGRASLGAERNDQSLAAQRATARPTTTIAYQPHVLRQASCVTKVSVVATDPAMTRRTQLLDAAIRASASGGHG